MQGGWQVGGVGFALEFTACFSPTGKYQAKHKGTYLGLFRTENAAASAYTAAAAAAKESGSEEASTPAKAQTDRRAKYKGTTITKRGDFQVQVYDAKTQRMKYVGRTQDAKEIKSLLPDGSAAEVRPKTQWFSKESVVRRFTVSMRIYTNDDGSPGIMSDLIASADNMINCPLLSVCCPALHFLSLMGKDGPWKEAISGRWSKYFNMHARTSSWKRLPLSIRSLQFVEAEALTSDDLMAMVRVLQLAAKDAWVIDRKDWDLNVNRNKLYFMGWQRMVTAFGSRERIG